MTTVIVGMLVALFLAVAVVALVAVPAHRQGRDLLSREGEQLVQNARERVVDLAERLPVPSREGTADGAAEGAGRADRAERVPAAPGTGDDVDLRVARRDASTHAD